MCNCMALNYLWLWLTLRDGCQHGPVKIHSTIHAHYKQLPTCIPMRSAYIIIVKILVHYAAQNAAICICPVRQHESAQFDLITDRSAVCAITQAVTTCRPLCIHSNAKLCSSASDDYFNRLAAIRFGNFLLCDCDAVVFCSAVPRPRREH